MADLVDRPLLSASAGFITMFMARAKGMRDILQSVIMPLWQQGRGRALPAGGGTEPGR